MSRRFSDRLLAAATLAFAALAGTLRIRSVDFFWHLTAGRWILAHGRVPREDPFRFTHHGVPWVDHEWLFQALLAAVDAIGGIPALTALRALVVTALAAVAWLEVRRAGAPGPAAALVVMAAVLGARDRFLLRPELVSLLMLALLLVLLEELRRRPRPSPAALAVLLVAAWANLHPAALTAPPVAAVFLLGCRLPGGRQPGAGAEAGAAVAWRYVLGLPAMLALALLANPYGARVLAVPVEIAGALAELPGYNPDWLAPSPRPLPVGLLLALAALVGLTAWRARRVDPATGLVALLLLALGLRSARHLPLFWVAAAWLAGHCQAALRSRWRWPLTRISPRALALLACALAAAWVVATPARGPLRPRGETPRFGLGIQPGRFPAAAIDRIADWPGLGNLYNDVPFGGYLLWRLYPERRVFVDSRNEVDPGLLREIGAARTDSRRWRALLERHAVDGALLRYDERPREVLAPGPDGRASPERHTPSALLFPRDRFALVYWDDVAMLFVRRTPAREAELTGREYRFVQPEDWRALLAAAAEDPWLRSGAIAELRRKLAEDPDSARAAGLLRALGRQ